MKKLVTLATVCACALVLAGCGGSGQSQEASSAQTSAATSSLATSATATTSAPAQDTAAAAWVDAATAEDAAKGAGLAAFGAPTSFNLGDLSYTNPKFAYAGGVAQATYETPATMVTLRKGTSTHSAPLTDRDVATFPQTWKESVGGTEVTMYGPEQGKATVLTWSDGSQSYGFTFQGLGGDEMTMDAETVAAMVNSIREVNVAPSTQAATSSASQDGQSAATGTQDAQNSQGSTDAQGGTNQNAANQNAANQGVADTAGEAYVEESYDEQAYSGGTGELTLAESEAVSIVQNMTGGYYIGSDYVETDSYGPCWYVATQDDNGNVYAYYVDTYGNAYGA